MKFNLIRLPVLFLVIFFVGKLVVGAAGGSYDLGNRLFAMVPLTVHLCLIWGALSRTCYGKSAGGAAQIGVQIALVAQILIVLGTLGSYALGIPTHFSDPVAVVGEARQVGFGEALISRAVGLVINLVIGALSGLIGWSLGNLLPRPQGD